MELPWSAWCISPLILLLGSIVPLVATDKRRCTVDDYRAGAPKQGFTCGKMIPRTLSLVCGGSYRSPEKRDLRSPDSRQSLWHDDDEPPQDNISWVDKDTPVSVKPYQQDINIFIPRASAFSYLRHRRSAEPNFRMGVYCECCVHMCTYREMQDYCTVGDRNKRDLTSVDADMHKQSWWTNLMTEMYEHK